MRYFSNEMITKDGIDKNQSGNELLSKNALAESDRCNLLIHVNFNIVIKTVYLSF